MKATPVDKPISYLEIIENYFRVEKQNTDPLELYIYIYQEEKRK